MAGVLLAKDAISTGWDCPRAEVLVSFRPAQDKTHITQLLGRMVRTPLARRIPGDDRLNSVECLLPFFDRKTATAVVNMLVKSRTDDDDQSDTGGGEGRRVLINPAEMTPNRSISEAVWDRFLALPSETLPKRGAKPVKRLTALAQALSDDKLLPGAGQLAHADMHSVLDGLAVRYDARLETAIREIETIEGQTISGHWGGAVDYGSFSEMADEGVITDAYRAASRMFSADVARSYTEHLAGPDSGDEGLLQARLKVAALAMIPDVVKDLEQQADKLAKEWLATYRVAIRSLVDESQQVYAELLAMSSDPQRAWLVKPIVRQEDTGERDAAGNERAFATRTKHLLSDDEGLFPLGSIDSSWETDVLDEELNRSGTVAWYRNPSRATPDSLAISYKDTSGVWRAMRPDFLFFSEKADGTIGASIVDPHGFHLGDALPKLRGLAMYAARYGDDYMRIESVAKLGDRLRVLDLKRPAVRGAILEAEDAKALYGSASAVDY